MPDTRPAHVPEWATTTNYATNPDPAAVGQPTKLDPSSIAAQGFTHRSRPNPRHFNYWMNEVGQWLTWTHDTALSTDGGTYVMGDPIVLQGQGITFEALASLVISASGPGGFFCAGVAQIMSGCDFEFLTGADLQLNSGSRITGDPNFDGGTWNWAKPQVNESTCTNSGTGHRRDRILAGANADQTYGVNNADEILIPLQTGSNHTYTLSATGAGNGSRLRLNASANTGSFYVQVATAEGTYFLQNVPGGAGGLLACLDVVYFSGAWHTSLPTPPAAL